MLHGAVTCSQGGLPPQFLAAPVAKSLAWVAANPGRAANAYAQAKCDAYTHTLLLQQQQQRGGVSFGMGRAPEAAAAAGGMTVMYGHNAGGSVACVWVCVCVGVGGCGWVGVEWGPLWSELLSMYVFCPLLC